MLLLSFALALQTQSITLSEPGASIKSVLARISDQTQTLLVAKGVLQAEPIVIRFKAVPLQEGMAKIAECVHARWVKTDTGFELERTSGMEKDEYREHIGQRSAILKAAIARFVKTGGIDKPVDVKSFRAMLVGRNALLDQGSNSSWDGLQKSGKAFPNSRAIIRLASLLPIAKLADIELGKCAYFATDPTPTEFGFNGDVDGVVRQLTTEYADFVEALDAVPAKRFGDSMPAEFDPFYLKPFTGPIKKLVLEAVRDLSGLRFDLNAFDDTGKRVYGGSQSMNVSIGLTPPKPVTDKPFTLSASDLAMHSLLRQTYGPKRSTPSKLQRVILLNPEKHDPVSLLVGPALIACANALDSNLVAQYDDSFFLEGAVGAKLSTAEYLGRIGYQTKVTIGGDWIDIAPSDRYEGRTQRMSRDVLGSYLRSIDSAGASDLNAQLRLAAGFPGELSQNTFLAIQSLIAPVIWSDSLTNSAALRFYALLTEDQRRGLSAGGDLSSANLNSGQTQALRNWIYTKPFLRLIREGRNSKGERTLNVAGSQAFPTEGLPGGLAEFRVSAKTSSSRQLVVALGGPLWHGASESTIAERINASDASPVKTEFMIGSNVNIELTVQFGAAGFVRANVNGWVLDTPRTYTYYTAPPDVKAEIDRQLELIRKRPANPTKTNGVPPPGQK